jgi:hypothetical protein
LDGVRPLTKSMNAADRASTGAAETSRFHQFVDGNTWRPTSGSSNAPVAMMSAETANVVAMTIRWTSLDTR